MGFILRNRWYSAYRILKAGLRVVSLDPLPGQTLHPFQPSSLHRAVSWCKIKHMNVCVQSSALTSCFSLQCRWVWTPPHGKAEHNAESSVAALTLMGSYPEASPRLLLMRHSDRAMASVNSSSKLSH